MQFLLFLPAWLAFLSVSAVTTLLALAGLHFVRKRYPADVLKENHEVGAIIFNAFGLLYGVVVAFVVFVTVALAAAVGTDEVDGPVADEVGVERADAGLEIAANHHTN